MFKKYLPNYVGLLKLALPLVLTQAGQMTIQLVDNAMVGRFGTAELAAASFANNVYIVVMLLGLGIFMGVTPLVGNARGAGNDREVAATMKNGFVLASWLIPGIALASWSLAGILPYMGQTDEVVRLAVPYYRSLSIAIIPLLMFALLRQIGEGLGNTIVAMVVTLASNLLKVSLNYCFIFGNMGFPRLGLRGAGYATVISRIMMPLLLYGGFMCLRSMRRYFALMRTVRAASHEIFKILKIGLPIAVQLVLEVSSFALSAVMMGWMGNVPLASHEISIGLASFTFMIANGVAMAGTIRISFLFGARDMKGAERVAISAVHMVLAYMGMCGLGFLLLRHKLPFIFTSDRHVIEQAAPLLAVAALFQLFDGLQVVCLGILRGFADVKAPMLISILSYVIVGLSVSYLCAFSLHFGPVGIWYGFLAGLIFAGSLLALRIRNKMHEMKIAYSAGAQ
jgi:multidrug resistance protein, MATE family